jgi:DNA-binding transcriptional regulator YhcF (GntR family)
MADRLRDDLVRQGLAPGTRLQPLRELARAYEVSYVTAHRAVQLLQQTGLLEARAGDGIYLVSAPRAPETIQRESATRTIGVVQPFWVSDFGAAAIQRVIRGLLEPCDTRQWRVELIYSSREEEAHPDFVSKILDRGVNGVAWLRPLMPHRMNLMRLADRGVDVVTCGRRMKDLPIANVSEDYEDIARKVVAWALERDRCNFGLLSAALAGDSLDPYSEDLLTAFRAELAKHKLDLPMHRVCQAQALPNSHRLIRWYVREQPDIDLLVSPYSSTLRWLREIVAAEGWPGATLPVIVDLMYEYETPRDQDVREFPLLAVLNPLEAMGQAMARHFERSWIGEPEGPEPDLSVRLLDRTGL